MNGYCGTCDVEKQCAYEYKPCECCDYRKFKPLSPEPKDGKYSGPAPAAAPYSLSEDEQNVLHKTLMKQTAPLSDTPTPRTDANVYMNIGSNSVKEWVFANFARELERELTAERKKNITTAQYRQELDEVWNLKEAESAARIKAEAECDALEELITEYITAYDNASNPAVVGSTCRLIRAESAMRDWLEDHK